MKNINFLLFRLVVFFGRERKGVWLERVNGGNSGIENVYIGGGYIGFLKKVIRYIYILYSFCLNKLLKYFNN